MIEDYCNTFKLKLFIMVVLVYYGQACGGLGLLGLGCERACVRAAAPELAFVARHV